MGPSPLLSSLWSMMCTNLHFEVLQLVVDASELPLDVLQDLLKLLHALLDGGDQLPLHLFLRLLLLLQQGPELRETEIVGYRQHVLRLDLSAEDEASVAEPVEDHAEASGTGVYLIAALLCDRGRGEIG